MGIKTSKFISVLPTETFNRIRENKNDKSSVKISENISKGYLYLVLPPKTSLNNFEKFGGKLILYLSLEGEKDLISLSIDNKAGIHVIKNL